MLDGLYNGANTACPRLEVAAGHGVNSARDRAFSQPLRENI